MKLILPILLLLGLSANAQHKFTVFFDFDIAESNAASSQSLSKWITDNPLVRVQKIYGYTDKTGDSLYNHNLSERRTSYIYQKLKAENVNVDAAEQKGFGESRSTAIRNPNDRKVVIEYAIPEIQPVPAVTASTVQSKPDDNELSKQISSAKKGDKLLLKNLNFYNNEDVMLPSSVPVLKELLKMLKEHPNLKIQIQGHVCCEVENKLRLSRKRALAVYNFLVSKGISKKRLSYTSFGSTKPIYPLPEKTEAEMSANRRVEIEIIEN